MVDINGYEIKSAFSGGEPLKAIYSLGVKVWPVSGPEPATSGWLCFTALEDGKIGMSHYGTNATTTKPNLSYSKDGVNWTEWDYTQITVSNGDVVYFKGINNKISHMGSINEFDDRNYSCFYSTGKISASGNIMSLLYGDDFEGKLFVNDYCFHHLFFNCTGLTTAPDLPATTVGFMAYASMFSSCTSLTTTPNIYATTLSNYCYYGMFGGCTSLTSATELPATKLSDHCYYQMFSGCTSLVEAPKLPATKLENYCYDGMFEHCTSLTTAPDLPATTLSLCCYEIMFRGCTSLTTAPALPATKLVEGCYLSMFSGCTSLTTAPALPATKLVVECYEHMFYNCYVLNYIKANFTTTPSTTYTNNWLNGVASKGKFVANPSATWPSSISRGSDTVPSGWSIVK